MHCEGIVPESAIHIAFSRPQLLKEYKHQYCEEEYKRCRIAEMLWRKWEENDGKG